MTDREPTIAEIQQAVCERFGLRMLDMKSQRRAREVARPRQVAMYLARELTPHSYPEIGRAFGGRDHTTAMHACHMIIARMAIDRELADAVLRVIDALRDPNQLPLPLAAE